MDVYVGGLGHDTVAVADRIDARLREVDVAHHRATITSDLVHAWIDDPSSELLHHRDDDLEVVFDGYLYGHGAASTHAHLATLGRRLLDQGRPLAGDEGGIFNVVAHDRRSGRIVLGGDPSGLLPLYVTTGSAPVRFASHLHLLADAIDAAPDLVGVAWMIRRNLLYGGRTTYAGIRRLCAGEVLEVRPDGTRRETYPEVYFSGQHEPASDPVEQLWDALRSCFEEHAGDGLVGTMLSEGFDSRLVAGLLHEVGVDQRAFTHATPGTTGLSVARRVAATVDAPHEVDLLDDGYPADRTALRRQLLLADNLHLPMWIHGADHFRALGTRAATSGYALDATIGAHAFTAESGSQAQRALARYRDIVRQSTGRIDDREIEQLATETLGGLADIDRGALERRVQRFLAPPIAASVNEHLEELAQDVHDELDRIRSSGDDRPSQVLQRFFLENRGRRYSFGQELTLRTRTRLIVPSYEPRFLRVASTLPPRLRLQHRLYVRLFRRHLPELSRVPSGAHLLPITWPRLALETGRFVGVARERRILGRYFATAGSSDITKIRGVLLSDDAAHRATRLPMEGVAERAPSLDAASIDRQVEKIRGRQIRVYLPVLYNPIELAQIFDRSA